MEYQLAFFGVESSNKKGEICTNQDRIEKDSSIIVFKGSEEELLDIAEILETSQPVTKRKTYLCNKIANNIKSYFYEL
jgi:hypothetical protein